MDTGGSAAEGAATEPAEEDVAVVAVAPSPARPLLAAALPARTPPLSLLAATGKLVDEPVLVGIGA
jgi:hypothetical protein